MPKEQLSSPLNKIAIVRHGSCDRDNMLTSIGSFQMRELGMKLKDEISQGENPLILSSIAPRAVDSAKIIADELEAPIRQYEELLTDSRHPVNVERVYEIVRQTGLSGIPVVVTHFPLTQELLDYIVKNDLKKRKSPLVSLDWGQGVVIDCRSRKVIPL